MLGGHCSCASSLYPIPPPKHENPLSPFFLFHTRIPSVSPLFPLDTKMRGGGSPRGAISYQEISTRFNFFHTNPCICFSFLFALGEGKLLSSYVSCHTDAANSFLVALTGNSAEGISIYEMVIYHSWLARRHFPQIAPDFFGHSTFPVPILLLRRLLQGIHMPFPRSFTTHSYSCHIRVTTRVHSLVTIPPTSNEP
jgi:hypothetical protein